MSRASPPRLRFCAFALLLALFGPLAPAPHASAQESGDPAANSGKRGARTRTRATAASARVRTRAAKPTVREKKPDAAQRAAAAKRGKRGRATAAVDPSAAPAATATPPLNPEPASATHPPAEARAPSSGSGDAAAISSEAEETVRKDGESEIKTVEFSGLDIEGQLKSPQMLYFLNRLRAEFDRPELPHRSFMPELQRGTKEPAF